MKFENRKEQKRNIIILSNLFPTQVDNTRGIFTLQIAKQLSQLCNIQVVCPLPYFPRWNSLKRFEQWYKLAQVPVKYLYDGIQVYSPKYLMIPKISEHIHASLVFPAVLRCLLSLKNQCGIDLVNAHWLYPDGVSAVWACKVLRIPIVLTALGCDVNHYPNKFIIGNQIKKAVRGCDGVTAVSTELALKMEQWSIPQGSVSVIRNGVDVSLFRLYEKKECRKRLAIPSDGKIILFVGRLSSEKGFDTLINSISILKQNGGEQFSVVVVGDGPERGQYETQIKKNGLTNQFIFKGFREHSEIPYWYGASDLLCLPSIREGCPNVVLESLASGRPVIASRVGGIPEMIADSENGFLFTPGNHHELANKLDLGISMNWSDQGLRQTVDDNSWAKVAEQYFKLYVDAINKCNKGG